VSDQRIDVAFGAQITQLLAGLTEMTGAVRESVEEMKAQFQGLSEVAELASDAFIAIGVILEGGEIFKNAIEKTAEMGKQLEIASQKTGMEAESLSALQYAANLSDVSLGDLNMGLTRLARGMEAAEKGTGPAADALQALDINAVGADGHLRPMHDVLLDLAERFAGMEDGAGKTAIAMDLFGRSGATLIPLLNQGRDGITELEAKAKSLGVTMGEDGVSAANRYVDQMKEFHAVMDSLERQIALNVMPTLTMLAGWLEVGAQHFTELKIAVELVLAPGLAFANIMDRIRGTNTGATQKFLADLERALPDLRDRLDPSGLLAVLPYHSGEDRPLGIR